MNPFGHTSLYSETQIAKYRCASAHATPVLPPHVFRTAAAAQADMVKRACGTQPDAVELASQSILMSGESGSGKTWSTRQIMRFIAETSINAPLSDSDSASPATPDAAATAALNVAAKVLAANPLTESVGNAKTTLNDNSSRFGKYVQLQMNALGELVGARVTTYLLEKSRVLSAAPGERLYHVFYQIIRGCNASLLKTLGALDDAGQPAWPSAETGLDDPAVVAAVAATMQALLDDAVPTAHGGLAASPGARATLHTPPCNASGTALLQQFHATKDSAVVSLRDGDDPADWAATLRALHDIGAPRDDVAAFIRLMLAVLALGNVHFEGEEAAEVDPSSAQALGAAAAWLGIPQANLSRVLTVRVLTVAGDSTDVQLRPAQAAAACDAVRTALYSRAFDWLVAQLNASVAADHATAMFCGLLDIFGFEVFTSNNFEQLCINYCNEKLQGYFNSFIFSLERAEYQREGVPWSVADCPDNSHVLSAIEAKSPPGVFALLDAACSAPGGTDQSFASSVHDKLCGPVLRGAAAQPGPRQPLYATARQRAAGEFAIQHYAAAVTYTTTDWLEKNRDNAPGELQALLASSTLPLITQLQSEQAAAQVPEYASQAIAAAERAARGLHGADTGAITLAKPSASRARAAAGTASRGRHALSAATVSTQFKSQLTMLLTLINATSPHFVRCIKPNTRNEPRKADPHMVLEQLRCGGVLEAVRVARQGYPVRQKHSLVQAAYTPIARALQPQRKQAASQAQALQAVAAAILAAGSDPSAVPSLWRAAAVACWHKLETAGFAEGLAHIASGASTPGLADAASLPWVTGKSKVFFRRLGYDALAACRADMQGTAATILAAQARGHAARRSRAQAIAAIVTLQAAARAWHARAVARQLRAQRAAVVIQAAMRAWKHSLRYERYRYSVILLQAAWRGGKARAALWQSRKARAASALCAWWRAARQTRAFRFQRRAAVALQCRWRQRSAMRTARALRVEARSVAGLQAKLAAVTAERDELARQLAQYVGAASSVSSAAGPVAESVPTASVATSPMTPLVAHAEPEAKPGELSAEERCTALQAQLASVKRQSAAQIARLESQLAKQAISLQVAKVSAGSAGAASPLRPRLRSPGWVPPACSPGALAAAAGSPLASPGMARSTSTPRSTLARRALQAKAAHSGASPRSHARASSQGGMRSPAPSSLRINVATSRASPQTVKPASSASRALAMPRAAAAEAAASTASRKPGILAKLSQHVKAAINMPGHRAEVRADHNRVDVSVRGGGVPLIDLLNALVYRACHNLDTPTPVPETGTLRMLSSLPTEALRGMIEVQAHALADAHQAELAQGILTLCAAHAQLQEQQASATRTIVQTRAELRTLEELPGIQLRENVKLLRELDQTKLQLAQLMRQSRA